MNNMDSGTALGLLGGYYQATGATPDEQIRATRALIYLGDKAKDGRSEALIALINSNLQTAQRAQGGKALTDAQTASVMATTTAMYNGPGTMGFNSNMFNALQNGLAPGGDTTSELIKFAGAGGFEGPMTASRMFEIKRNREKGLDPAGRARLNKMMAGMSTEEKRLFLFQAHPEWQDAMYDEFLRLGDSGAGEGLAGYLADGTDRSGAINGAVSKKGGIYKGSPGATVAARAAKRETGKINFGEKAEALLGPLEDKLINGAIKLGDILDPSKSPAVGVMKRVNGPEADLSDIHDVARGKVDATGVPNAPVNLMSDLIRAFRDLGKLPDILSRLAGVLERFELRTVRPEVLPARDEKR